ncbi:MAG: cmk [Homoserinimonas sp.]|nr:cmk [Homoserinimonas sp.]
MSALVVAVDGPAGSGKSSVSRAAARKLGFDYQDTGAAYRALAWFALERGIDTEDADAVSALLPQFTYRLGVDPDNYFVRVGETDVETAIREPRVSAVVSHIARVLPVRAHLVELFRRTIAATTKPGIITEGRDITTVVSPDAQVRILLTASEEARMGRRAAEVSGQSAEDVAKQLTARDAQDSRVIDFMNAADGVITIDSTQLNFDETIQAMVDLVHRTTG